MVYDATDVPEISTPIIACLDIGASSIVIVGVTVFVGVLVTVGVTVFVGVNV